MIGREDILYLGTGIRDTMEPSLSRDLAGLVFFSTEKNFGEQLDDFRERMIEAAAGRPIVISDEALSFAEYMKIGHYWGRPTITDHDVIARRLSYILPDAAVTMTLRGQMSMLASFYRQSEKVDYVSADYRAWLQEELCHARRRSILDTLDYGTAAQAWRSRFDHVNIFLHEDNLRDVRGWISAIEKMIELPSGALVESWEARHSNKSPDHLPGRLEAPLRALVPPRLRKLLPESMKAAARRALSRKAASIDLDQETENQLIEWFTSRNRAFEENFGLRLPANAYPGGTGA